MWNIVVSNMLCSALYVLGAVVSVWGMNDEKLAKGTWYVDSVIQCPNEDQYRYKIDMKKSKMNRTHDWFHAKFNFLDEVTATSHGLHVEFCKKVDGGCKLQYQMTPASFCNFVKEHSESNFIAILSNIGLENLDCPVPAGDYELQEFPFNYSDMPENGLPGQYVATSYLMKADERVSCIMMEATFTETDDDDN